MAFRDKVVVITGASSGIGWELARVLAGRGAKLGVLARRRDRLESLAEELRGRGAVVETAGCDVSDKQQTLEAIGRLRERLGPVDLLVANSGIGQPTEIEPINLDEIDMMIRVNLLGVVYAVAGVLPEMLQRGRGHLAAVSSLAAYKGLPGESAYCASKAAVCTYMEGLRIQLKPRGIHVTTICPGFIRTPMTSVNKFPMPFLMDADRAAHKIARALERRKKVYNFPWGTTFLMKLTRWLPDFIVRRRVGSYTQDRPKPSG